MTEDGVVQIAAVGLGWVTTNRHIPAIRRCRHAKLVGLVDHQPGRSERIARELGVPLFATATNASEVQWLDRIDAVTIGTPPRTHHALATTYLEAGKHVLVEKPLAMTVDEAQQLIALAVEREHVLAVVHNFQFMRSARRVKQMMEDGALGEIQSIWAAQLSNPRRRLPTWYEPLPLGLFYDESPHLFYLLRHLTGCEPRFRSIDVVPARDGTATPVKITALLEAEGLPIQIDMNFRAPLSEWHVGVFGSKGAGFVDMFRDILVVVPNDGLHLGRDILRTSIIAGWSHMAGTVKSGVLLRSRRLDYGNGEVIRRFCLAGLGDRGALAGMSASDGVAVVSMQHQVIEAAK
jgi:predicted dehydrogenase